jgi:hypothetical protein
MKQISFSDVEYDGRRKQTRREIFAVRWNRWCRGSRWLS